MGVIRVLVCDYRKMGNALFLVLFLFGQSSIFSWAVYFMPLRMAHRAKPSNVEREIVVVMMRVKVFPGPAGLTRLRNQITLCHFIRNLPAGSKLVWKFSAGFTVVVGVMPTSSFPVV